MPPATNPVAAAAAAACSSSGAPAKRSASAPEPPPSMSRNGVSRTTCVPQPHRPIGDPHLYGVISSRERMPMSIAVFGSRLMYSRGIFDSHAPENCVECSRIM
jgi:hypothetical protein